LAALRDQGAHYLQLKRFDAAQLRLEQASRLPGGEEDFKTHLLLARVYYAQLVLERAFPAARKAVDLAMNDQQRERSVRLLETMDKAFGGVTLTQAEEQVGRVKTGHLHLVDAGGLINVKKKEQFHQIRDHFDETPVELPVTIYLPFGRYTVNLVPFETKPGERATVVTFLDAGGRDGISPWWWVAGGVVAAGAAATAAVLLLSSDEPERHPLTFADIPVEPAP